MSYPALLAAGLPPVTANVTNTVALVFNGVGSVSASRPELVGQGRRLLPLGVAALLGGVTAPCCAAHHRRRRVRAHRAVPHRRASVAILVQAAAARAGC